MIKFTYNQWNIQILDQRPRNPYIQVNIFNPNDDGHSLISIFPVNKFGSIDDLEKIKNQILQDEINSLLEKAEVHFGSLN